MNQHKHIKVYENFENNDPPSNSPLGGFETYDIFGITKTLRIESAALPEDSPNILYTNYALKGPSDEQYYEKAKEILRKIDWELYTKRQEFWKGPGVFREQESRIAEVERIKELAIELKPELDKIGYKIVQVSFDDDE